MEGRTLAHFRILEKIGAGGMGVVYRAHDERLDRDVALKVLPPGLLSDDAARRRFRREALALSRLNHPGIATVFDFDTQEGVDFLVMEHIQGVTLSEKLAGGPLSEKEVAALGAQIASALEGAHERGVVHRDLKPGNIMVTSRGQAKVLDFGLATLLRPAGEPLRTLTLSQEHPVVGTLPYMAPEQLRGEAVDARSDIYAAGAVLFEMATGQRLFPHNSAARLIDAIQHEAPPAPSAINRRILPALDGIVLKALDKDPKRRYQSAAEMRIDLERLGAPVPLKVASRPRTRTFYWALAAAGALLVLVAVIIGLNVGGMRDRLLGRAASRRIESLAVLPLANLSGDPEQDYFAEGMTEALITNLAKIGALRVISRTSVMQYKEAKKLLPEIGRELGVDAVIEGSVLRSGERVRITAQLVVAASDRHLWAESYDRDLRDVLKLQSEVAQAIAREIRITLTPQAEERLAAARPVDPQAHDAYLRGRFYWGRRSDAANDKAIDSLKHAIEIDPGYAPAYAALADCYIYTKRPPAESMTMARAAALKALALDEGLAEAHVSLGNVRFLYDRDFPGAEGEFGRAIEVNPASVEAHHQYSHYLLATGRIEGSLRESRRALELDPLSPSINGHLALHYLLARQYDEAADQCRRTLDLDSSYAPAHEFLGRTYEQQGKLREAIAEFQKTLELGGSPRDTLADLGHAYAIAGRRDGALKTLVRLRDLSKQRYVSPVGFALIYAGLGMKDEAFSWLDRAFREHDDELVYLEREPRLDSLRPDPRFTDLLRRIGLPS